jgi:hypothetical protein
MKRFLLSLAVAMIAFIAVTAPAQSKSPLRLVHGIPLPNLKEGDFDHSAVGHRRQSVNLSVRPRKSERFDWLAHRVRAATPCIPLSVELTEREGNKPRYGRAYRRQFLQHRRSPRGDTAALMLSPFRHTSDCQAYYLVNYRYEDVPCFYGLFPQT